MDEDLKLLQRLADCGGMEMEFLELRRDAERYRWLRAQHWNTSPLVVVANPRDAVKLGYACSTGNYLDDDIDAAMGRLTPNVI